MPSSCAEVTCWLTNSQTHIYSPSFHCYSQWMTLEQAETLWLQTPQEEEREALGFNLKYIKKVYETVSYVGCTKLPVSKMKPGTCLYILTNGMRNVRQILFRLDNLEDAYNSVSTQSTLHAEPRAMFVDVAWDQYNDQRFRGSNNRAWLSNIHPTPISHILRTKWTKLWSQVSVASVGLPLTSTKDPYFLEIATMAQEMPLTYTDF